MQAIRRILIPFASATPLKAPSGAGKRHSRLPSTLPTDCGFTLKGQNLNSHSKYVQPSFKIKLSLLSLRKVYLSMYFSSHRCSLLLHWIVWDKEKLFQTFFLSYNIIVARTFSVQNKSHLKAEHLCLSCQGTGSALCVSSACCFKRWPWLQPSCSRVAPSSTGNSLGLSVAWLSLSDHRPDIIRQRKLEEFEERKHKVNHALRSLARRWGADVSGSVEQRTGTEITHTGNLLTTWPAR